MDPLDASFARRRSLRSRSSGGPGPSCQNIGPTYEKKAPAKAKISKQIPISGVDGFSPPHEYLSCQGLTRENLALPDDPPRGVNNPAHTCVRGSCDESTVLNGSEGCHREVLEGGRGSTEPGIIGDRHQKVRALSNKLPVEIGKDDFIADQDSEFPSLWVW